MTTPAKYAANYTYSDQETLDLYREAIAGILATGQAYETADGRRFEAAQLAVLQREASRLEIKINLANNTGSAESQVRLMRRGGRCG